MSDREILDSIVDEVIGTTPTPQAVSKFIGTDLETMRSFLHDMVMSWLDRQQEDHDGLSLVTEEELSNLFLAGWMIGTQFTQRKTEQEAQ